MKFLTFTEPSSSQPCLGVQTADNRIVNITHAAAAHADRGLPADMMALIAGGDEAVQAIRQLMDIGTLPSIGWDEATFLPPVRPGKNVFCVGRNYREHIIEGNLASGRPANSFPEAIEFFTKATTALNAHRGNIQRHAALTNTLDYEVELAIVIGRRGVNIPAEQALDYVFGYTIVNDVTARNLQKRHGQWFKGKSLDSTCPMGPVICHHAAIGDPNNLQVSLEVNGEVRQNHNTNDMIFNVQRIIAELSAGMTLEPGDVISTGTPQGVGYAMTPPRCLEVGDVVTARVQNIGELVNVVTAD